MQNYPGPMMGLATAAAVLAAAGGASGQENFWFWEVEYSNPAGHIASAEDTATVTLWAEFDESLYYAFHAGKLAVTADDFMDSGIWSSPLALLRGPMYDDGIIDAESVVGIVSWQLYYPEAGIFPDPSDPIAVWSATWRTAEMRLRTIPLATQTTYFGVFTGNGDVKSPNFDEGLSGILVVPAPSTPVALSLAFLAVRRRRR